MKIQYIIHKFRLKDRKSFAQVANQNLYSFLLITHAIMTTKE